MGNLVGKSVDLQLVGLDGNAFSLMGAFQRQAQREKWSREEIDTVLTAAKSGDYNNLLCVLMDHCSPVLDEDDDEDYYEDEDDYDDDYEDDDDYYEDEDDYDDDYEDDDEDDMYRNKFSNISS